MQLWQGYIFMMRINFNEELYQNFDSIDRFAASSLIQRSNKHQNRLRTKGDTLVNSSPIFLVLLLEIELLKRNLLFCEGYQYSLSKSHAIIHQGEIISSSQSFKI